MITRPHIVIMAYTMNDAEPVSGTKKGAHNFAYREMNKWEWILAKKFLGEGGSYAYYHFFKGTKSYSGT